MKNLFGLNFFEGDKELLLNNILKSDKAIIFTPNIDHIIKLNEDIDLYNKYSQANFIIADGWPVALTGKLKKFNINRITGIDLMDNILKIADEKSMNIFLLGNVDETLIKINNSYKKNFPNMGNLDFHNGFFEDDNYVLNKIKENKSDILFVGMGCPKQEKWIIENIDSIECKIIIGVGGAFNIYSGDITRAPKFMQTLGLEWFYRFLKEPKRLFKRYFIEDLKFVPIFVKELIKKEA
ncbi:WecB/TagA/CpsF family glycosyltransferase [uncultured Clostridium sp.]|uniref:WecB/TagA/CpsF family glycosyltransferase n=1 Tax=uncultured Clostridium sp. TaxID=59620 RepID=UPI002586755E|nr:WecB/TagA/CpsF family glycosyltransferase [uncultured Clostridium sp.]